MKTGLITVGKNTKNHTATLAKFGYKAETIDGVIHTQVSEFVNAVDFSTGNPVATLATLVRDKKALTYKDTKIINIDGKEVHGCNGGGTAALDAVLKGASCLMMRDASLIKVKKVKPATGLTTEADFLAQLGL